jgi:sulfate permease, SulP family
MLPPESEPTPLAMGPNGLGARWQQYRKTALADDLIGSLIVTVLLVPQSLAYAMLAGLPPVVGVMASLLPLLAYAAFGSSNTLAVGPVAVLAMMVAQSALPVAAAHGVSPHLAALVLSLEMAAILMLALVLRLEVLAALLSAPVLHGFIAGAALAIAMGQLPSLLGLGFKGNTLWEMGQSIAQYFSHGPASAALQLAGPAAAQIQPMTEPVIQSMTQPSAAAQAAAQTSAWGGHTATALVGLLALAALWLSRHIGKQSLSALGLAPRAAELGARLLPMAVVLLAIAAVLLAPQALHGVALAGRVDLLEGLNFKPFWQAPWALWWDLAAPAGVLGLVAYVESLAVAEALAARRGEKVLPRRELLGISVANAASGLSGGMPVTGSFSRSTVNFDAGVRTRMAGLWTALLLTAAILLLGGWLAYLPKAVLAATIIVAVLSLLELHPFQEAWRHSRAEFALMAMVAALTWVAGVELALLVGVLLSVGLLLQRTARPHWAEVGRLPGTEVYRNVNRYAVETLPHVLAVRVDESLVFTNSRWLGETLLATAAERPALTDVVLMMSGVNDIDLTGTEGLLQLDCDLRVRGQRLHLSELKGPLRDRLERMGLERRLSGNIFATHGDAVRALTIEPARL